MPEEKALRVAIVAVSLIGMAAAVLSVVAATGASPVCLGGGGGCRTVATSPYAELAGVRVSYLGMLGFAGLIATALIAGPPGRFGGACIAVAGAGFSIYLTVVELTVIDAVCEYCLVTAASMVVLSGLTLTRLLAYEPRAGAATGRGVRNRSSGAFARRAAVAATVAIAAAAALIAVSRSSVPEGWPPEPSPLSQGSSERTEVRGVGEVRAELAGLPQAGAVIGRPGAPVTVTEFGDLQCPLCAELAVRVVPALLEGPVADGEAKLEFRNWAIFGPQSTKAAKAALAAGRQDRMWDFVSLFYRNQGTENTGYVTDGFLTAIADQTALDTGRWDRDRERPRWGAVLAETDSEAQAHGFAGTPGIVVTGPGGVREISGIPTSAELENAIAEAGG